MLASHCPEFDKRWTHEFDFFQIRLRSYKHRHIREAIFNYRMAFFRCSWASAATSCVITKSLACQKNAGRLHECSPSWWFRVFIFPFAWPSWSLFLPSCFHRMYIVWSSVPSGVFHLTKTIRTNHDASDCLQKATRLRKLFVMPSYSHRTLVRLNYDDIQMALRCRQFKSFFKGLHFLPHGIKCLY